MEIIVGKTAGFCYGVNRAVEGSKKILKESKEGNIYCLGEIVHNKTVVDELKKEGIKFINKIEEAKGTTIIRAHGVPKEIYKEAENKKIELKDYTCPNVLKIHEIAKKRRRRILHSIMWKQRTPRKHRNNKLLWQKFLCNK